MQSWVSLKLVLMQTLTPARCRKVKGEVSRKAKLCMEAPVNRGRNDDGPKVAKFLLGSALEQPARESDRALPYSGRQAIGP
jgi:hypothetical protein